MIYWAVETLKEVPHPTLVAEGIRDFEWSPKDNMIAYWAPEKGNIPAKVRSWVEHVLYLKSLCWFIYTGVNQHHVRGMLQVCLVELPEKKTTQKNIFGVLDCQLFWQSEGDFLCVKVNGLAGYHLGSR